MDSLSSVLEHRSASNIVVPSLPHARKLWEGGKVFLSFVFEQLGVRIKISLEKKTLNIGHKKNNYYTQSNHSCTNCGPR